MVQPGFPKVAVKVEVLLCERPPSKKALGGWVAQEQGRDIKRPQTKETGRYQSQITRQLFFC